MPLSWSGFPSSLPCFYLAWMFAVTWIRPYHYSQRMVRYLMYVMVLEFIVVHSTFFLGGIALGQMAATKKAFSLVGIGLFYSLFAGAISLAYKNIWPFLSFWGLTLTKLHSYIFEPMALGDTASIKSAWAFTFGAYITGCFITLFLPVPRLGITDEVIKRQDFKATGLWVDRPEKVIGFGMIYFLASGLFELLVQG